MKPVFIKYRNNLEYSAIINFTDDTWYFTNGSLAAKKFGFKVPTTVYLEFQFHENRFNMTHVKPNVMVNPFADKRITLSSSESDDQDVYENPDEHDGINDEVDGSDDEGYGDSTGGESGLDVDMDENDDDDDNLYKFDVYVTESLAEKNQVMVCCLFLCNYI
jgi:hypothetical protein